MRELSGSPHSVPSVKARVRVLDLGQCTSLAEVALGLDDAPPVRQLVASTETADVSVVPYSRLALGRTTTPTARIERWSNGRPPLTGAPIVPTATQPSSGPRSLVA